MLQLKMLLFTSVPSIFEYQVSGISMEYSNKAKKLINISASLLLLIASNVMANEVRLIKEGGVYHLPVKINDAIELKFVVDTGAADVHIPADVALTLIRTGTISKADFRGKAAYQMADGSIKENAKFILRSLQIGTAVITNIEASVGPVESTLLLGQSALEKLEPWRMETKRGLFVSGDHSSNHVGQTIQENPIEPMQSESGVIYFAAELPPTENIPPEAPLCYKFQVASPDEQLKKLKKKYPELYGAKIETNADGSKNLIVNRRDESGALISYFYSTNPRVCNMHQEKNLGISGNTSNLTSSTLASSSFNANEWLMMGSAENMEIYVLPASIKIEGNYIRAWSKIEFNQPSLATTGGAKAIRKEDLFDCRNKQSKTVNVVAYDRNKKILTDHSRVKDSWEVVKPYTFGEIVFDYVCRN